MSALPPGSTIGILGGGQLGRMLAMAAARLGYRCHIYSPTNPSPAAEVAAEFTCADYTDAEAMARFADAVDVVTYEFENVDVDAVRRLTERVAVHPPVRALDIAQNRVAEKRFFESLGGRPAPWAAVDSRADLDATIAAIGTPAILKTVRYGYDGKGQARLAAPADADAAWAALGGRPAILEGFIDFEQEYSVLVARGADGALCHWDIPANVHHQGMLAHSAVPAGGIVADQAAEAIAFAGRVAEALDHVGVFAIEFFGGPDGPIVNEMAPRVHNSGHWTIEGAIASQFENHIRAVVGLPLGDTSLAAARVEMANLIGDAVDGWPALFADPRAHVHLYGKGAARPGRKMGHVTRLVL